MSKKKYTKELIIKLFEQKTCLTITELSLFLKYSLISVRRFLKEIGYYSSFTNNSTWYTLKSIPVFNKRGLWFYQEIGFSKHGNFADTIIYFIENSRQGLTAKELSEILLSPCHPVLNMMYKNSQISRYGNRRSFIYLSINERIKKQQLDQLQSCLIMKDEFGSLQPQTAIYVLIEYIKQQNATFRELSKVVEKKRKVKASPEAISKFFEEHDLKKSLQ